MNLVVISSPDVVENEAGIVQSLFEAGLQVFHCRKPHWTAEQTIQLIQDIPSLYRDRIAIHHHHEIAAELGLKRLHFTEEHRKKNSSNQLQAYKQAGISVSTSLHQLSDYDVISELFEYVFYGPVFNSISKQGYASVVSNSFVLPPRKATQAKRIGLGGIEESNLTQAFGYGFEGIAVLGTLWSQPKQALERFIRIKERTETIQHENTSIT